MKKNILIVVLGLAVIVLGILHILPNDVEPARPSSDQGLDQTVETFFRSVANQLPDQYAQMVYGWEESDESRRTMMLNAFARTSEDINEGGGLDYIHYFRAVLPLELVLNNGDRLEVRQALIYDDGEWKIQP